MLIVAISGGLLRHKKTRRFAGLILIQIKHWGH
jgi:hypothetical protein